MCNFEGKRRHKVIISGSVCLFLSNMKGNSTKDLSYLCEKGLKKAPQVHKPLNYRKVAVLLGPLCLLSACSSFCIYLLLYTGSIGFI